MAVEKSDMAAHTFYVNFIDPEASEAEWKRHLARSISQQAARRLAVKPLREVLDDDDTMNQLTAEGVDVVVGGPPCQGFSLAGRRNPHDVRNKLPWEYLEFVARTDPKLVVIENVVGMNHRFSSSEEPPFIQLQQALRETGRGYEVQGVAVNALHYGAPQNRPRLMIIGVRVDVAARLGVPAPDGLWASGFLDELQDTPPPLAPVPSVTRSAALTVADAIGDLQGASVIPTRPESVAFRQKVRTVAEWGIKPARRFEQIPNQAPRSHTEATKLRFRVYQWIRDNAVNPRLLADLSSGADDATAAALKVLQGCNYPAIAPDGTMLAASASEMLNLMSSLRTRKHTQKALDWQKPARTVVTLPDDYVHPSEPRIFTVREMARFQGFPDDFVFMGKETTGSLRRRFEVPQYSQVGNAVSPMLAAAVGKLIAGLVGTASGSTNAGVRQATTSPEPDLQTMDALPAIA